MTDPMTQAQADAEQVRLVREALALRREHPAEDRAPTPQVLRFFPSGPRPSLAEAGERSRGGPLPAPTAQPGPPEARVLPRRTGRGREGAEPTLR